MEDGIEKLFSMSTAILRKEQRGAKCTGAERWAAPQSLPGNLMEGQVHSAAATLREVTAGTGTKTSSSVSTEAVPERTRISHLPQQK